MYAVQNPIISIFVTFFAEHVYNMLPDQVYATLNVSQGQGERLRRIRADRDMVPGRWTSGKWGRAGVVDGTVGRYGGRLVERTGKSHN